MRIPIEMPQGPEVGSSVMIAWFKSVGDDIRRGDPIAEVETEKMDLEIEAFDSGILAEIVRGPGDEVAAGDIIGYLEAGPDPAG